ncbi:MAG: hypothetical protein ACI9US_002571, partial [Gammaproteobacteria bacterium]
RNTCDQMSPSTQQTEPFQYVSFHLNYLESNG